MLKSKHSDNPVEQDANKRAFQYFCKYYPSEFNCFDLSTGMYNGKWDTVNNPISGVDWNNYFSKTLFNEVALRRSPMEYYWYDSFFVGIPILGELIGGWISRNRFNNRY